MIHVMNVESRTDPFETGEHPTRKTYVPGKRMVRVTLLVDTAEDAEALSLIGAAGEWAGRELLVALLASLR